MTDISILADEKSSGGVELLSLFGSELQQRVRKLCSERLVIERRWVDDMRQYMGLYAPETVFPVGGSKVFINITRPRTEKAEAQLVDMLFTADDKNYGISATPNPEFSKELENKDQVHDENGNPLQFADDKSPVTGGDVAKSKIEMAEDRAVAMEREIDDQLIECDYAASARKAIRYAAILGSGILCGPEVEMREQASWKKDEASGDYAAVFKADKRPVVRHVLPWDFFPDMSAATIQECNDVFERSYMSKKSLKKLSRISGIHKENLRSLIEETDGSGKQTQNFSEHVSALREMSGIIAMTEDTRYEVWRYRGPIKKEVLVQLGVIQEDQIASAPNEFDGIVIFCGDKVLKAAINPMDTEDWPYSVFNWHKDDNCIFGYGVPYTARHSQSVINTSWRLMLDNATKSAGPQVVRDSRVKPENGSHEITPWKVWTKTDPSLKVNEAFQIFTFPSVQTEIANIFNMARALIDEETDVPAIAQGEQGQVTPTVGGMSMLMNAAKCTRRNQIKQFDDDVTVPLIKRFYDWNMQYNEKEEIKGDMKVNARGISALLAKEQNSQALFNILNNYVGHPVLGQFFENQGLDAFRKAIQSLHINPDDLVKSLDVYAKEQQAAQQAAQANPPQQDPRVLAEQMRGQSRMAEIEAQAKMKDKEHQVNYAIEQMRLNAEMVKSADNNKVSLEKIAADMKKAGMTNDLNMSMFKTELQLKIHEGMTANYGLDGATKQ